MNGLAKRITAAVLTIIISMTGSGTVFAADEKEEKGFWESVGDWFVDRGTDIGNATTTAVDATGEWLTDRGKDISEVSSMVGNWTIDRATDVAVFFEDTGEAIAGAVAGFDPSVLLTKEYYLESGEKLLLGEYSDKDPTALSIGLNLAASVVNADIGMDIRDLVYDVQNFESEEVKLSGLALDAVAVLPFLGILKGIKYVDTLHDASKAAGAVKAVADTAKTIDAAETIADTAKIIDAVDDAADTAKTIDAVDAVADTAKTIDAADAAVDTVKTADGIDNVSDISRATDRVSDTTKASDAVDDVSDTAKASDVTADAVDAGKEFARIPLTDLNEKAQETFRIYEDCAWDGEKALDDLADGTHAGQVWGNRDGDLPLFDTAGNKLSYKEYDAFSLGDDPLPSKIPGRRGPCRFIRDNLGNTYFTDDHYETFSLISETIME